MAKNNKKQSGSRFPIYFTFAYLFVLSVLYILNMFRGLDNKWADAFFRTRGMQKADEHISLVAIDDVSIEKIGEYPWRRRVYARLLDKLFDLGVKVVGFDIHFPDASSWAEDDKILADATRKYADRVVHAVYVDPSSKDQTLFRHPYLRLTKATRHFGMVTPPALDADGSVRRTTLFMGTDLGDYRHWAEDPKKIPVFAVRILSLFEGKDPEEYLKEFGNYLTLNVPGQREVDKAVEEIHGTEREVKFKTEWEYGIRRIAAWRVLEGQLTDEERETLKGGMVVLGSIAVGAFDHYPNPFFELAPGAEIHITLIDNLLRKRALSATDPFWNLPIIFLMGGLGYAVTLLAPLAATLSFAALLALWFFGSYYLFLNLILLECAVPTLALVGVFIARMVHRALMEEKKKREMRGMFGQYVSPEIVDILVKDPSKIRLGGDKRDMTVFFLDIAHFTTISEKMTPEDLIKFLNHYLTALTDVILSNKGVVDKYIGDCVMAFWNAPLDTPGHRSLACKAATECIEVIERLNKEYVDPSMPEKPAVRIGLNSGEVVVGNTGSARKLAYTVLGDEVNLASRLEGANKFFGSTVMASESTYAEAKDTVEARVLGQVRVVGKAIPIRVYELLAKKGELSSAWKQALPAYEEGVKLYLARDFEKAKGRFKEVQAVLPGDKPSKLYLSVCEDYSVIPPGADWDGVFNLTAK